MKGYRIITLVLGVLGLTYSLVFTGLNVMLGKIVFAISCSISFLPLLDFITLIYNKLTKK